MTSRKHRQQQQNQPCNRKLRVKPGYGCAALYGVDIQEIYDPDGLDGRYGCACPPGKCANQTKTGCI
jgi:hypothetical protein